MCPSTFNYRAGGLFVLFRLVFLRVVLLGFILFFLSVNVRLGFLDCVVGVFQGFLRVLDFLLMIIRLFLRILKGSLRLGAGFFFRLPATHGRRWLGLRSRRHFARREVREQRLYHLARYGETLGPSAARDVDPDRHAVQVHQRTAAIGGLQHGVVLKDRWVADPIFAQSAAHRVLKIAAVASRRALS